MLQVVDSGQVFVHCPHKEVFDEMYFEHVLRLASLTSYGRFVSFWEIARDILWYLFKVVAWAPFVSAARVDCRVRKEDISNDSSVLGACAGLSFMS